MLLFQEGFYSSGVECSADEGAVPRLCGQSLMDGRQCYCNLTPIPGQGPLTLVVFLTHRSNSWSRKAMIITLSKHLPAVWLIFFYSEKRILDLQSGAGADWK